jgi:4'-phosphopantetheinyl transferase
MRSSAIRDDISDVFIADLTELHISGSGSSGVTAFLTDAQRRRYGTLRNPSARRQFLAVRQIARAVLAEALGILPQDVALAQRCPLCSSDEHGRPLPERGISVSWSHTSTAVAVAVSRSEIGVDIESIGSFSAASAEIEAMVCTPEELGSLPSEPSARQLALARLWTAKEALIKVGEGDLGEMWRAQVGVARPVGRTWHRGQGLWWLTPVELGGAVCTVAAIAPVRAHFVKCRR